MTTQTPSKNGTEAPASTTPGDDIRQALAQLLQQGSQTNHHLQNLTNELSVMNRQLFQQRPPGLPQPVQQPLPSSPYGAEGFPQQGYPQQGYPQQPLPTGEPAEMASGGWRKQIIRSRCSEIGITKTLPLSKWKLNFFVDGYYKPASAYSGRGIASLIQLARGVWPEISEDHFSETNFEQRNKEHKAAGKDGNAEERFTAPEPFVVEWYEKPGNNGRIYAYVERVYPINGLAAAPVIA